MSEFYNKYPYTDFHELNLDWIISKMKELSKRVDFLYHEGSPICVKPEEFGAVGDGLVDDTEALKKAQQYAYDNHYILWLEHVYGVTETIRINCSVYTSDRAEIKALANLPVVVQLCTIYDAVTNDRRMKDIKLTINANNQADKCVEFYRPEHCNITIFARRFLTCGIDLGAQSSGNDENVINLFYEGSTNIASEFGVWLRGSDNNIQSIYGYDAKYAVKISDSSLYSIDSIHTWIKPDRVSEFLGSAVIYNDIYGARLNINTLYNDTMVYMLSGTGQSAANNCVIHINTCQFHTASPAIVTCKFFDPVYDPSNSTILSIDYMELPQPLTSSSIEFESLLSATINKILIINDLNNAAKLNNIFTDVDVLPLNSILPVRINNVLHTVETKYDGCEIIQTKRNLTSQKVSSRMRTLYSTWSDWHVESIPTEYGTFNVSATPTLVDAVVKNKIIADNNQVILKFDFTTPASVAAYTSADSDISLPTAFKPAEQTRYIAVSDRQTPFLITFNNDGSISMYNATAITNVNTVCINLVIDRGDQE